MSCSRFSGNKQQNWDLKAGLLGLFRLIWFLKENKVQDWGWVGGNGVDLDPDPEWETTINCYPRPHTASETNIPSMNQEPTVLGPSTNEALCAFVCRVGFYSSSTGSSKVSLVSRPRPAFWAHDAWEGVDLEAPTGASHS